MNRFRLAAIRRLCVLLVCSFTIAILAGTSVWSTALSVGERAIGRVIRIASPGYGLGAAPVATPTVTATKAATLSDLDGDAKADPGEIIRYSVLIGAAGADATDVHLADALDANTTLVPGSVHASPIAMDDSYTWVGNTQLDTNARGLPSLTANDVAPTDALVLNTTPVSAPSHGSVTLLANGHFVYTPAVGYTGTDSFTYSIANSTNGTLTGTGTVTINLTGLVWYLQAGASGDGRSNTPSGSPSAMSAQAAASGTFYVFSSPGILNGAFTLKNNQQLLGQGVPLTVNSISLFSAGAAPAIANTGGDSVTLASGNNLQGFTIGNTSGRAIVGSSVGALTVSNASINTNGQALDLTGVSAPTVNVNLTSVTSSGGTKNVNLVGLNGTIALGSGALSGASNNAFDVSGGAATITYSGTVASGSAHSVSVTGKTGGSVTFSGAVTDTDTGITLTSNTGATINFTGALTINTSASGTTGFNATGGGTVTATGSGSTINSGTGTALNIANTTIGASGVKFQSISAGTASDSAGAGIVLDNTGSSGTFAVTGTGTANSGGTIQHKNGADIVDGSTGAISGTTGVGVFLRGAANVDLSYMNLHDFSNYGVFGSNVNGFVLRNSTVGGVNGNASNGHNRESAVAFKSLVGVAGLLTNQISGGISRNVDIDNQSGTLNLTATGNNIHDTTNLTLGDDGFSLEAELSATVLANISNNTFSAHRGDDFNLSLINNAVVDLTFKNNTVSGGAPSKLGGNVFILGATFDGSLEYDISNNTVQGAVQGGAIFVNKGSGTGTFSGQIVDNVIGNPAISKSGAEQSVGIHASARGAGGSHTTLIHSNEVYQYFDRGIVLEAGEGSPALTATVTSNTVSNFADAINSLHGIHFDFGILSTDNAQITLDVRNNLIANAGNEAQGGVDFRMRTAGSNDTFIAGYTGGNSAANAQAFIDGQNPDGTTFAVTQAASGTYNNGPSVPLSLPNLPEPPTAPGAAPLAAAGRAEAVVAEAGSGSRPSLTQARVDRPAPSASDMLRATADGAAKRLPAFSDTALLTADGVRVLAEHAFSSLVAPVQASGLGVDITVGTVPANKTITVAFDVTVNAPPVAQYTNQATISGSNFGDVLTNTVTTPGDRFATTTTLISSLNPADQGTAVTFTATVTPSEGFGLTPNGTVQFKDNGSNLGSAVACADAGSNTCSAQLTTASLTGGVPHSITADYLGGTNHDPGASAALSQTIIACTTNPIVTTSADTGAGSLRQAMLEACGGNTITFSMGAVTTPIGLTSGTLTPARDVTINGPGADQLTVERASGAFGIFTVPQGRTVTISGLTIANGLGAGGGVSNAGTVTIKDSAVIGGSGGASGGGLLNSGTVAGSSMTIIGTTVSGNSSAAGGGIANTATAGTTGSMTIVNSTISGNTATADGGGILNQGSLVVVNSTVANNRADSDADEIGAGGGLAITGGTVTLRNTIAAGNFAGTGTTADDVAGTLDTATSFSNVIGVDTGMTGATHGTNGNQIGTAASPIDPKIGPLADNGGATQTHALLPGSPAIDAGDSTFVASPPFIAATPITDQRGTGFGRIRDSPDADAIATVDIGAFELDPSIEDIADKITNEDTPIAFAFNVGDGTTAFNGITASSGNPSLVTSATVTGSGSTRTLAIAPAAGASGTATITVNATKTLGGTTFTASDTFVLTVNPVADTPTVTSATTLANVQTASGLVISRNAADGSEVTHFKITSITGGTLFLNDGTTQVANGSFITFAQGNAGLRFTPTTGSTATGHFTVQASLAPADGGLGGAPVTADIIVNKHATTTTIVSALPDPSDRLQSVVVQFAVASADGGPTPTGAVTVTVAGGPETCTGTVADGQCTLAFTVPGPRTVIATYAGDAVSLGSTGTASHVVNACPATPVVTNTADSGPGSLRQAVADACATDSISFAIPGGGPHTIALTTGWIDVDKNLTIAGSSDGVRISSAGHQIFMVAGSVTAALSNLTLFGGGGSGGGALQNHGTLTITDSTFSGNSAGVEGGAILNLGSLTITNSTFSGNSAFDRGGALTNSGTLALTNVTITGNSVPFGLGGGGVANFGALTLENTIVAGNTASNGPNIFTLGGSLDDRGHNLLSGDPKLGPLQDNGGVTFTHMPLPGSPALDAGDNAAAASAGQTMDQRGAGFTRLLDAADADTTQTVDIGAVEADPSIEVIADKITSEDTPLAFTFNVGDAGTPFDSFTATGGPGLLAAVNFNANSSTQTLTVTPAPNFAGSAPVTVTVNKTIGGKTLNSSTTFTVTVTGVAEAAVVSGATTAEDTQSSGGLVLTPNVADGTQVTHFRLSAITNGTLFLHDGTTPVANGAFITAAQGSDGLKFTPAPNFFGTGNFLVQAATSAAGAGLGPATIATITVNPVADTPAITNAATSVNTQSTAGLVCTRSPADGSEVAFVKIVSVSGGTLFSTDGTTSIAPGTFITFAQAAAGLKFTPLTDSAATGQVTVQASLSAGDAGLGGAPVTASITVTRLSSTTALTTSRTPSTPGQAVTFTATVTPTAAGAGTVQFRDGATVLGAPVTLASGVATFTTTTLAPGTHHITAEFAGNAVYLGSTATVDQVVTGGRTITTGSDASSGPHVRRFSAFDGGTPSGALTSFFAFNAGFTGGVRVAEADLNGDGVADIIAAPGAGAGPQVRVFNGASGALHSQFFAYDAGFAGGVYVAAGDIDGDGRADIVTGAGGGASPLVRVFSGASGAQVAAFNAFTPAFTGGVRVAAGDIDGDGRADMVTGAGPGGSSVRVFSGATNAPLMAIDPYPGFAGGVFVAAGDVNGDGFADVITGADAGGGAHVRVFNGRTGAALASFFAVPPPFAGGIRVAAGDVNGDGRADIITSPGTGGGSLVRVFDGMSTSLLSSFSAYEPAFTGGVFVATAAPENRFVMDAPLPGTTVRDQFRVAGWAIQGNGVGTGVDTVHVWAHPVSGQPAVFLGAAVMGDARPDVASIFGDQYLNSGYHLDVSGLPEGTYDIKSYAHNALTGRFNSVRTSRVTVRLPVFDVQLQVDVPAPESAVSGTVRVAGWAIEKGGAAIEAVHVWDSRPNSAPVFVGAATLGDARPDVAAAFGPAFGHAGYHLDVTDLAPGQHTLLVFAKAAGAPDFAPARAVPITVMTPVPTVFANIDAPAAGRTASGSFAVAGWALTKNAPSAPGVQVIHVWARPVGGGAARFLGAPTLGLSRPDVAAAFGSAYLSSGFNLAVTNLPAGTWDIEVFIWPTGATTFTTTKVVRVTVP